MSMVEAFIHLQQQKKKPLPTLWESRQQQKEHAARSISASLACAGEDLTAWIQSYFGPALVVNCKDYSISKSGADGEDALSQASTTPGNSPAPSASTGSFDCSPQITTTLSGSAVESYGMRQQCREYAPSSKPNSSSI